MISIILIGGHVGGLELWNRHRCAEGMLTFPNDFPETTAGSKYMKDELIRLHHKSEKLPKSKDSLHDVNLLLNMEKVIPTPPGVTFTNDQAESNKVKYIEALVIYKTHFLTLISYSKVN